MNRSNREIILEAINKIREAYQIDEEKNWELFFSKIKEHCKDEILLDVNGMEFKEAVEFLSN